MIFDKDEVGIAERWTPAKPFAHQQCSKLQCQPLVPGEPIKFPPKPTSGILNTFARRAMLEEYAKNPLVFTVPFSPSFSPEQEGPSATMCRHYLGFGFSKEAPYFPPGTIVRFVGTRAAQPQQEAKISGIAAAYGSRSNEYAVILSFDVPVHPDAASAFLDSYNMTEIDGGDEGLCACLANIIRKYTHTIGDVDPACASSDAMETHVSGKFEAEVERMFACIADAAARPDDSEEGASINMDEWDARSAGIFNVFARYRQALLMHMRHQPLGTREWMQMFETYMSFGCSEEGLGFIDFVLR